MRTGSGTWISNFVCVAAVVLGSLGGEMWRGSPCRLRNAVISKSVALSNGLRASFFGYCPCCCLPPCSRTTRRISWTKGSVPPVYGIWRLQNRAFWPSCNSLSSPMMVLSATTVPMLVCFCRLVVCLYLHQRDCNLHY